MLHRRVKVHGRQSSEASATPPCPWGQPASMAFLSSVLFYIWKAVSKLAHAHWTMDWKLSPCQPLEAERSPASREIHYFQSMLQGATPSISKTASAKDRIDASIHVSWNLLKVKIENRCTHREELELEGAEHSKGPLPPSQAHWNAEKGQLSAIWFTKLWNWTGTKQGTVGIVHFP